MFNPAGAREAQRAIFFHNNGELARGHAGDWHFMVMNEQYFNQRDGALPQGFNCECYLQNNPQHAATFHPSRYPNWEKPERGACYHAYEHWLQHGINNFESATCGAGHSLRKQTFDCDCYLNQNQEFVNYYVRVLRYRPQVGDGVHAFKNDKFRRNELQGGAYRYIKCAQAYNHFLSKGIYEGRDASCERPFTSANDFTRETSLLGRPPAFTEDASFIDELNGKVEGRTFGTFSGDIRKRNSLLTIPDIPNEVLDYESQEMQECDPVEDVGFRWYAWKVRARTLFRSSPGVRAGFLTLPPSDPRLRACACAVR